MLTGKLIKKILVYLKKPVAKNELATSCEPEFS